MNEQPGLQSRLWSWLVLVVAFAITVQVVWALLAPLLVSMAVVVVVASVGVSACQWRRRRNFW